MKKVIYADYDDEGIYIYQAFKPKIVRVAVELGTFGKGFGLDRITWIKPSLCWLLRRSKYGTKNRMQAIARIKLTHEGFKEILSQSIETHWDESLFPSQDDWSKKLNRSDVIHQWDPERDLIGKRLDRQAIQIGIRGNVIRKYVSNYIMAVEDISELAHEIGRVIKSRSNDFPKVPIEKEYEISSELFRSLGCNN